MVARMLRLRLLASQLSWVLLTLPQRSHRHAAKVFRPERLYFSTKRKADVSCRNSKTTSTHGLTVRNPWLGSPQSSWLAMARRCGLSSPDDEFLIRSEERRVGKEC